MARPIRGRLAAQGWAGVLAVGTMSALLLTGPCRAAQTAPVVRIPQGSLSGVKQGAADAYLGIPYAAPPVGQYRWRSPQLPPRWMGVRKATRYAASCWQFMTPGGVGPWSHEYVPQGRSSEDCLYLNIWTSAADLRHRMPVLVWIPGGGFIAGSGSVAVNNGASFAARGIVVVTINYRVGLFGFLTTPAIAAEAAREHEPPGNWGLQDMIAALQWVHRNIAAFGGDPDAITIGGQSAGAMSVDDLIASPLATGLFQRAIAGSGFPETFPHPALTAAEQAGEKFARSKAASLAALRALTTEQLTAHALPWMKGQPPLMPCLDGVLLPAAPEALLTTPGAFADVPILTGIDGDEASADSGHLVKSMSEAEWKALLATTFGALAPRFATFYPAATGAQRARSARQLHHDLGLATLYAWSQLWSAHAHSPAYGYLFDHLEPGPHSGRWGIFHSSELPYVFGTLSAAPERHLTAADRSVSAGMMPYWVDFVKTGNPNGAGLAAWPAMGAPDPRIMVFTNTIQPRSVLPLRKLRAMQTFIVSGGKPGIF